VSSRGRLAIWWRLLLAVSVVAAPLALSGLGAAAGTWRGAAAPQLVHVQLTRAAFAATDKLSTVAHHAGRRVPGDLAADTATGFVALVWLAVATSRRLTRRAPHALARSNRTRAPPEWTAALVPFGPVPGRAGHFARSHRAYILPTTDTRTC
jgi:hypothetical protein